MENTFDPASLVSVTNCNVTGKEMKGNIEFKKEYATCCLGDTTVKLGAWDDGDNYCFDINMSFEGLFDDWDGIKKVNLSGRGYQELQVISEMFKDISDIIKANL